MLQSVNSYYKFRELKVYASTEWLAENKKKYRQVFSRDECTYIYAEFSFFNKQFDQHDWEINLELRCYSLRKNRKLLSVIPIKRFISRFDPVVYIREGWGNKRKGSFWKKGTYCWEVYADNKKIAGKYFFVEDYVTAASESSPLLKVKAIRLYEGSYDDVPAEKRKYCRIFDAGETRYVYMEMQFENRMPEYEWQCELFVKFYNDARELKGQVVRLSTVEKDRSEFELSAGWGSDMKGSWRKDRYTAELVFMDRLLAVIPFEIADSFESGNPGMLMPAQHEVKPYGDTPQVQDTFEKVMLELDCLIGLKTIKQKIREHAHYIHFLRLRKEKGFPEQELPVVHSVFIGNPGTGKTTVAGMLGRLYHQMGILSKGHVHEVDRIDLIGEYIGQTAPKVKDAIDKARGGVLFVDEAYSLARSHDDSKDFGREVIEILIREMSNGPGDLVVITAGYPREMDYFLKSNPGLRSRFKLFYDFDDYLPQEMIQIADYACKLKQVKPDQQAKDALAAIITEAYRTRDRSFGNARFVHDLIDQAKLNLGLRVMANDKPEALTRSQLETITVSDVNRIIWRAQKPLPLIPTDSALLAEALEELDSLTGMYSIKQSIRETVDLVRFYREANMDVQQRFCLHTVLAGNPGTGKTTVARILAKIYKALGMLERGHIVETDRQGLVAGFVGQTAIKTAEKIEEAMGGVLFIDEAYALARGGHQAHGDFGAEAVQTLLKRMDDDRGKFFVFAAGYPSDMDQFLQSNPGFRSRFDKSLVFPDYSSDELYTIALNMLNRQNATLQADAAQYLYEMLDGLYRTRNEHFGNARMVRNLADDMVKKAHLRLSRQEIKSVQTNGQKFTITKADIEACDPQEAAQLFERRTIGFSRHE